MLSTASDASKQNKKMFVFWFFGRWKNSHIQFSWWGEKTTLLSTLFLSRGGRSWNDHDVSRWFESGPMFKGGWVILLCGCIVTCDVMDKLTFFFRKSARKTCCRVELLATSRSWVRISVAFPKKYASVGFSCCFGLDILEFFYGLLQFCWG